MRHSEQTEQKSSSTFLVSNSVFLILEFHIYLAPQVVCIMRTPEDKKVITIIHTQPSAMKKLLLFLFIFYASYSKQSYYSRR
jgi:hypothetical protein